MKIVNRVFYIDVTGLSPNDIPEYMEKVRETYAKEDDGKISSMRKEGTWEDLFVPIRFSGFFGQLRKFFFGTSLIKLLTVEV